MRVVKFNVSLKLLGLKLIVSISNSLSELRFKLISNENIYCLPSWQLLRQMLSFLIHSLDRFILRESN